MQAQSLGQSEVDMNRLTKEKRIQVVAALVEGSSINSTVRMTGVSKPTILKLLLIWAKLALSTKIALFVTSPVSASSVMKFGVSVLPRTRISRKK
jgi:hypothetical protein